MIKCLICGNENIKDTTKFCSKCGAPLKPNAPTPAAPAQPPAAQPPVAVPPPQAAAAAPLPGEPDMAKLLAQLPDLEIKTEDLQIPVGEVDVAVELERLTQLNLEEQIKIIGQLEQQLKASQSEQTKT